jgi:hypothetical protein
LTRMGGLAWTSLPGPDIHGKEGVIGSSPIVGFSFLAARATAGLSGSLRPGRELATGELGVVPV